jgi:hypothetical protein
MKNEKMKRVKFPLLFFRFFFVYLNQKKGHSRDAPSPEIRMFLYLAANNYPGSLRDQNNYTSFDILANHNPIPF